MSFVVKRRDLSDPAQLQALIVEHADDLERGLSIVDSRLLLGQATIDVVALDADGALVLIAVGVVADEEMFLKAVEAYSWCLEYPESIRRLYPTARISTARPPRVMFVVERMPDAFHRKIKQLGIPEVDCVEFRHLDVDGTAAVYFDTLARLRRDTTPAPPTAGHAPAPPAPVTNGRPTSSVKLQKLLGADRPTADRDPAPVVRMVPRVTPRPEPKPFGGAPRPERPATARRNVEPPLAVRPTVPEPEPVSSMPAADVPTAPMVRIVETAPFAEPIVEPTLAAGPDLLAQDLQTAETMVEPFAIIEPAAPNGHVTVATIPLAEPAGVMSEPTPLIAELTLATPEPPCVIAEPALPAAEDLGTPEPTLTIPEPPLVVDEPERPIEPPALELEPLVHEPEPVVSEPEPAEGVGDIVMAEPERADVVGEVPVGDLAPVPDVAPDAPTVDDAPVLVAGPPGLELVATPVSAPESELVVVSVADPEPLHVVEHAPEPTPTIPVATVAESIVAEPEPVIPTLTLEPVTPVAPPPPAPAPSVFSRRRPSARTEPKVSFAGAAKDLLAQPDRAPEAAPAVSAPRASVEEITRAAIDDLVGTTEKRTSDERATAIAPPSGPFAKAPAQKRPLTIAPPPSDGQPIAGGPKLGTPAKRLPAPAPGPSDEPAAAKAADGESTQPIPQGFEGLQFPNDGVLTRQWMEFLNQMAAGK